MKNPLSRIARALKSFVTGSGVVYNPGGAPRVFDTTSDDLYKLFGYGTVAGPNVDSTTAMQVTTVMTCIKIISEAMGILPGGMYERQANGDSVAVEHDLAGVLFGSPNADMTEVEFIETIGYNVALVGNWYGLKAFDGSGGISSIYPLNPDAMVKKRMDDGSVQYRYNDRGKDEILPDTKVWHVRGFGKDGMMGLSPIAFERQLLGMALATEEFQARFFANGAMPSWIVKIPAWLEDNQREKAKKNLEELWGGMRNAYKAQLLEGGMDAVSATMPLEDAQFLQLRNATKTDIFGMFRVPPHMGGELGRSTNNNIEQQALEFVQYCMLPYLRRIEASARKNLLKPEDRRKYFVRFNVEGLLRADSSARGELYSKLLTNGVVSRNEVRALENMNKVNLPGMDDYTVQIALAPIDVLRKIAEKNATIPQPATPPEGDPNQNPQGGGSNNPKSLTVVNEMHLPEPRLVAPEPRELHEIVIPAPQVTVIPEAKAPVVHVAAPEVNVAAPEVKVINPIQIDAPDMTPVADALKSIGDRIIEALSMETEVLRDKNGNATGTKKVSRKDRK
jgi:HK97 family phage portal protein